MSYRKGGRLGGPPTPPPSLPRQRIPVHHRSPSRVDNRRIGRSGADSDRRAAGRSPAHRPTHDPGARHKLWSDASAAKWNTSWQPGIRDRLPPEALVIPDRSRSDGPSPCKPRPSVGVVTSYLEEESACDVVTTTRMKGRSVVCSAYWTDATEAGRAMNGTDGLISSSAAVTATVGSFEPEPPGSQRPSEWRLA
jgi:hypothetical protein